MNTIEYIKHVSTSSRGKAALWFRYLNKMLTSAKEEEYKEVLIDLANSGQLDPFQKSIVRVIFSDHDWLSFVKGLSKKADTSWIGEKYGLRKTDK